MKTITTPLTDNAIDDLKAGDEVLITGKIITARDAAHKKLCALINKDKPLPVDLKNQIIYYVGPTPPRPGRIIGSAGPTTASRMDPFAPTLFKYGLKGTIGKGYRNQSVIDALKKYHAIHFSAIGGISALLAKSIKSAKIIAYPELGPEAIYEFIVEDLPVIVAYDSYGNSIYRV